MGIIYSFDHESERELEYERRQKELDERERDFERRQMLEEFQNDWDERYEEEERLRSIRLQAQNCNHCRLAGSCTNYHMVGSCNIYQPKN